MLRLLVIASLVSGFVACATKPSATTGPVPPPRGMDGTRTEIETLDNQLAEQLARMEIEPFTATCAESKSCTADPPAAAQTCAGTGTTCENTCALGESICSNATKICDLARQLGGLDAWANEKCTHARESCTAARERCCNCKP